MANQEQVALLKQGTTLWNIYWEKHNNIRLEVGDANIDTAHPFHAGLDIDDSRRTDLNAADLKGISLCHVDLRGVDLRHADISEANFSDAILTFANLERASLWSTCLNDASLRRARLSFANLSSAELRNAKLNHVNLHRAVLRSADLRHADLREANLSYADLREANLCEADLRGANLSHANFNAADLRHANLSETNLRGADLNMANLREVNLSSADLQDADFHATHLGGTIFEGIDLCVVKRLGTAIHDGPSMVNINSVHIPEGDTRIHFLQGSGFSDTFIDYYDSLFTTAIQYASCFISYAHQDEVLARRLYKDLQDRGVRCWFAPHDLRPGTLFHRGIEKAIQIHETVILLLSEYAVASNWVAYEVETTLNRQARERCDLLFPLRLDEAVLLAKEDWAARLRESRHIGDFTSWQDDVIYQQRFAELLRHLKVKTM